MACLRFALKWRPIRLRRVKLMKVRVFDLSSVRGHCCILPFWFLSISWKVLALMFLRQSYQMKWLSNNRIAWIRQCTCWWTPHKSPNILPKLKSGRSDQKCKSLLVCCSGTFRVLPGRTICRSFPLCGSGEKSGPRTKSRSPLAGRTQMCRVGPTGFWSWSLKGFWWLC
jgi:hypothetical protein